MKNLKSFLTILLAILGLTFASSCSKEVTCECDLEGDASAKVTIDIKGGKCEDMDGEISIPGYLPIDIDNCDEE